MRILVDFLPVSRGGGLQNAMNFWRAVARLGGEHRWLALARPELELAALTEAPWQSLETWSPRSLPRRVWTENVGVPAKAGEWRADLVLTPMGAGPIRARRPTVIGWHDSTVAYPESPMWGIMPPAVRLTERLRGRYAGMAARRARRICVQTRAMARRLAGIWGVDEGRFQIIPNGPSTFLRQEAPAPEEPTGPVRTVLVIGEPKPAKNLEIVPGVAAELLRAGIDDVEFHVTIEADGGAYTGPFSREEARAGRGVPIRRIGRVSHAELGKHYRDAAVVFLPSLLESFSATYVEAMHFGVPLVTSDLDFAREICGPAALYADPLDPVACAGALTVALNDPKARRRVREEGFRRVETFPDWDTRFQLYLEACRGAVEGNGR